MTDSKVVVITGASSGLGKALSLRFGKKGNSVCGLSRNKDRLRKLKLEESNSIDMYPVDVSNPEEVKITFDKIIADHGRIDVLINNAGVIHGPGGIDNQSMDSINRVIDTNLKGTMFCSYSAIPSMMSNGGGMIINISSSAALTGFGGHIKKSEPSKGIFFGDYGASKWGVAGFGEGMTQPLRQHNIHMTTIFPGAMNTSNWSDGVTRGSLMELDEVVDFIEFLVGRRRLSVCYDTVVMSPAKTDF